MDLSRHHAPGGILVEAVGSLELIESYPDDKYLPSYLVRGQWNEIVFHALLAADVASENVRVVTMYVPRAEEWDEGFRLRKERL